MSLNLKLRKHTVVFLVVFNMQIHTAISNCQISFIPNMVIVINLHSEVALWIEQT
jgi:flagellar biosynthesis protein FliQ